MQYYGQWLQDKILNEELFLGKNNGTFVEIGCASPVDLSNSYFFEKELGWHGLCIDARKSACEIFAQSRKSKVLNVAIGENYGRSIFLDYGVLSGLVKYMSIKEHETIERYNNTRPSVNSYWVDVVPFSHLLPEIGESIDLLMIDTEGAELPILRNMNQEINRFSVCMLESNSQEARLAIKEHMLSYNFSFYKTVGADDIFLNNAYKESN